MVTRSAVRAASIIRVDEYVKADGIFHPKDVRYVNNNKSMWKPSS